MSLIADIADLMRRRGESQARAQAERGQIWGHALANIGQTVAVIPAQMQQAKAMEEQTKLRALETKKTEMQMAEVQRKQQKEQDIASIFQKYPGDIDSAIDELVTKYPDVGMELHKHQMEAKTAGLTFREKQLKHAQESTDYIGQLLSGATDQATYTKKKYEAQQAGIDVSQYPADFEEAKPLIASARQSALTMQQQIEAELKKVDDERQAAAQRETERHNRASEVTTAADKARLEASQQEQARHNRAMEARPVGGASGMGGSDIDAIAEAIANGEQPPTLQGLYRNGAAVRAALAKKGFNLAQAETDWKATQKHVSTLNGAQQTRMGQAIDNAAHSLDVIEDLAKQWDGGKFPILNKAQLALAKNGALGPKAQQIATQLEAQIADVTSELANVYMGGNSPTDHALGLAAKNLSADWTRDQLRSAINLSRKNLQIRSNSMRNVGVAGASAGNPYAAPATAPTVNPTMRYNPKTGKVEPIK
jgi:hypothetical protein